MSNLNLVNSKPNLIILNKNFFLKTPEMLSTCSRREFYINKDMFFLLLPHSKDMTSQRGERPVAMLTLDKHYDDA